MSPKCIDVREKCRERAFFLRNVCSAAQGMAGNMRDSAALEQQKED